MRLCILQRSVGLRWHTNFRWECTSASSRLAHTHTQIENYYVRHKPLRVRISLKLSAITKPTSYNFFTFATHFFPSHSSVRLFLEENRSQQFQVIQDGFSLLAIFQNLSTKPIQTCVWFPPTFPSPHRGSAVPLWTSPLPWIAQPRRSYEAWKMAK